jgi:thiamine biosynthesis lipoprotein
VALAGHAVDARVDSFAGETMGTRWSLRVVAPPANAVAGVQAALDRVVAQMSQWEAESDLSRFNRTSPGRWQSLRPEFARVLKAALEVAGASGGAFDPAMGALTDLWGFGPATAPRSAPSVAASDGALTTKGAIEFDGPGLRARRTGEGRLDFSGIAKGFGVDLAADWLLGQGAAHFLLEVGGELRGEGIKPDRQPWWIDVEQPPGSALPPLRVAAHGLAVATSGNYRRWLDAGGRRYSHTLDPRTGRPIDNGVQSVTVLHPQCMLADAWATALTVLGVKAGMALAEEQGLAARIIADDGEFLSPALMEMLG